MGCFFDRRLIFCLLLLGIGCPGGREPTSAELRRVSYQKLERFGSEEEFDEWLDELRDVRDATNPGGSIGVFGCADGQFAAVETNAPPAGDESITNNQVDGVDEGDIVKAIGDYFVILRRGRLFSVRQGDRLVPISRIDAYPKGFTKGTWYDEMLVHGDRIVVIGYSYEIGATEIGLFRIDGAGVISHVASHFVSSNDYYSSRNYASRLAGDSLILYMPYFLFAYGQKDHSLPTIQSWIKGNRLTKPKPLISADSIYKPVQGSTMPALHTVLTCDLSAGFECRARAVIGPYARTFYVSANAIYIWVSPGYFGGRTTKGSAQSYVYRVTLEGDHVGVLRAFGQPIDQFSFHEADLHLDVVLSDSGAGDWMWGPEVSNGNLALLRVPLTEFRKEARIVSSAHYRKLPRPSGWAIQNRFVGDHLLYGSGSGWYYAESQDRRVFVTPIAGEEVEALQLQHDAQRIEVMGDGAVVVGVDGEDLVFSSIALGEKPAVADVFRKRRAAQGETRSHGFFFKRSEEGGGVLGLPIRLRGGPWSHLFYGSAEVLFLRADEAHRFTELGALEAHAEEVRDDACQASCVDWYGNARPIFYRGRTYALMGYEIVEGRVDGDRIVEIQRVDYALVD